jgi:hypothetical protein
MGENMLEMNEHRYLSIGLLTGSDVPPCATDKNARLLAREDGNASRYSLLTDCARIVILTRATLLVRSITLVISVFVTAKTLERLHSSNIDGR